MEIQELIIKSYGKFRDHSIAFKPGINIIYGDNESGKSTIHSFIRAMFFGLNRARGKAARTDEYKLRQPWDAPGAFMGSMRIKENDEIYRIDRCFDRSTEPLALVNETRASESEDPQGDLDALLGGISEAAFVNSVFIPQAHAETDEGLAEELRRTMINSDSAMDEGVDVTRALDSLRKKKKKFEQQKKREDERAEEEISRRQEEADRLKGEIDLLKKQAYGPDGEEPVLEEEENGGAVSKGMRWLLYILLFLAGALCLLGAVLLNSAALRTFLAVFAVVFWLLLFAVVYLFRPDKEDDKCPPALMKEIQSREERLKELSGELEALYREHAGAEGTQEEIDALDLAIDRICELSDGIFRSHGGKLNEIASDILSEITEGKYSRITINDAAEVRVHTPSRVLGLEQLSFGTLQQIYFALRMAAGEFFSPDLRLPVILDEPFAMYDDRRLTAALRWLADCDRQVILFSCQTRERELLKKI